MSLQSRARHAKQPNPTTHPLVPSPYKHIIPQRAYGLAQAPANKTKGAFHKKNAQFR